MQKQEEHVGTNGPEYCEEVQTHRENDDGRITKIYIDQYPVEWVNLRGDDLTE